MVTADDATLASESLSPDQAAQHVHQKQPARYTFHETRCCHISQRTSVIHGRLRPDQK